MRSFWLAFALLILATGGAWAQVTPTEDEALQVLSVEHDPAGAIIVTIRLDRDAHDALTDLTSLVDGLPRAVERVDTGEIQRAAIVLAIDTSGSMVGDPLTSARAAALELLRQLPSDDRVSLLTFSEEPRLLVRLSTDREAVRDALQSIEASGATALYETVNFAAATLTDAGDLRRVLVLLSDGRESGDLSSVDRADSLAAIADVAATAYVFGLGDEADVEYLSALADMTGGQFWGVADDDALAALFAQLGGRLGATDIVRIATPPLAIGEHELSLRAVVDGRPHESSYQFTVANEGLITARAGAPPESGAPLAVELAALVPLDALRVEATARGVALPVLAGEAPQVLVDPWLFEPGALTVRVNAYVAGRLAATTAITVDVPPLEPQITIERSRPGSPGEFVVRRRLQTGTEATLAVFALDEELARSSEPELYVTPPPEATDLFVELRGERGEVLASRSFSVDESPSGSSIFWLALLALGLAGGAIFAGRRVAARWRRTRERPLVVLPRRVTLPSARRPPSDVQRGTIVVRGQGEEHSCPIGLQPVTVGRSPECDIVLDDGDVRLVHVRVSATPNGEYRVHGIDPGSPNPGRRRSDEWLLIRAGEELQIGGHVLTVHNNGAGDGDGAEGSAPRSASPPRTIRTSG
jgi:Mg-chelatase subunit ChlD